MDRLTRGCMIGEGNIFKRSILNVRALSGKQHIQGFEMSLVTQSVYAVCRKQVNDWLLWCVKERADSGFEHSLEL
jgi:hypothetical protein